MTIHRIENQRTHEEPFHLDTTVAVATIDLLVCSDRRREEDYVHDTHKHKKNNKTARPKTRREVEFLSLAAFCYSNLLLFTIVAQ